MASLRATAVTVAGAALAVAALVACSSSKPAKDSPTATVGRVGHTQGTSMPTVRTASDIATYDGQTAIVVGTYEVEPIRRGAAPVPANRRHQGIVYVKLDDDTSLRVHGQRPEDERLQFLDQRVEVEATVLSQPPPPDDPRAAQLSPMPTLVDIKAVRPAS